MEIDADLDPHYKIRGSETLLSDLVHLPIVLGGLHLEERVSVHLSAGAGGRVLLLTLFILLPTPLALPSNTEKSAETDVAFIFSIF